MTALSPGGGITCHVRDDRGRLGGRCGGADIANGHAALASRGAAQAKMTFLDCLATWLLKKKILGECWMLGVDTRA